MRVVFADRSRQRFHQIYRYIAKDDQAAAVRVISRIRQSIEMLADFPFLGREWEDGVSRALSVTGLPYRIHYQVDESAGEVQILTVVHTRRIFDD